MKRSHSLALRQSNARRRRALVGFAVFIGALAVAVVLVRPPKSPSIADAQFALKRGDLRQAIRLSEQILRADPSSKDAMLVAGRSALRAEQPQVALHYFRSVGNDGSAASIEALMECAQLGVKLGRLSEAEAYYRSVLTYQPEHLAANQGLLNLLRIEGRNWEALPSIYQVFRHRQYVFEYLALTGPLEAVWLNADRDVPYLEYCGRGQPADLLYLLGPIRSLIMEDSELDKARQELQKIVAWNPDLVEAQAALGQLLFNRGAEHEFLAWHSRLPKSADRHPSVWITRGRWARDQGQSRAAIRCLWEANRIYPNDRAANLLMANLLAEAGDREQAELFQRRGEALLEFDNLLMWGDLQEIEPIVRTTRMIAILEQIGRLWEARGWSQVLLSMDPNSSFAASAIARLDQRLTPDTPLTLTSANLARGIDYSRFPLPDLPSTTTRSPQKDSASVVSFDDVAPRSQLDFTYFVDRQRFETLVYTFDFAGGGVGALDYDQDGWPDLYLTQSCSWPQSAGETLQNQLFRNHHGESFKNCTELAGVGDTGFGNGVAVGDVNSDGFPDLYVNNLGCNCLYLNNGDGTFTDWTQPSGTAGDDYSLSAVFVDLNRDALPELYVVNYLDGDAMTRQCQDDEKPIQCSPLKFPGQQDRLYLNLGDGGFQEITDESGILDPEGIGKGMDVIAADLDGVGGPDLFVANDTTANFLYLNSSEPGSSIRLRDHGTLSGAAFDDLGHVQSSMGIAARDVNHDGLLDLFLTNFYRERNNLYLQTARQPSLLFSDRALASNLSEPSYLTMGWGTQFLDAELDGDWDLAVANGYLDENRSVPANGRMPTQFFENEGTARFRELSASQLGPYFVSKSFGRAMARLDWNRDGLEDLCVTHMGAPVALLQNTSRRKGRFAAIQLRGTGSCRDAIGSVVQITAGGKQWTVQLVGGGGFEASSQPQILVGLGECSRIEQLKVRWPDETEQSFGPMPVDCELLLIQGRQAALVHRVPSED